MSIEAVGWAFNAPLGGNAKIMLLGLANHAHPDGTEAYPSLDTLARYGHCDRSTARRNVRKLIEDGWIVEDGFGPKGQVKYRLVMDRSQGGGKMPPRESEGVASGAEGVASEPEGGGTATPPEPSLEPSLEPSEGGEVRAGTRTSNDPRDSLPEDFPEELRPHAREVFKILRAVARDHGAKRVWPLAVGRAMMAQPRKPFVEVAHELATWAVDPPRPVKDVVATYRTFLSRRGDLEATERLAADGTPQHGPVRREGVTPIRGGRDRKGDDGTDAERARRMLDRMRAQREEGSA